MGNVEKVLYIYYKFKFLVPNNGVKNIILAFLGENCNGSSPIIVILYTRRFIIRATTGEVDR